MRKKIAVVGDKGSVLGFNYGIIFITEQAYAQVPEIIDAYKEQPIPAIIPIPGKDGSLGIGIRNVKKNVERAVGADILFNED